MKFVLALHSLPPRQLLLKYQKELKALKHTKNQLLAKAAMDDTKDKKSFENWSKECKTCVEMADEHETKMEMLIAKVEASDSVGKDKKVYENLLVEVQAARSAMDRAHEGIQLRVKRFKKFLA